MATSANVKPDPGIKPDPEDAVASPMALSEDNLYEDIDELEFYDPNDPSTSVYLANVPKYLYDQWSQMSDDQELVIGKIRQWTEKDKDGREKIRMSMLLDARNHMHQTIPKEYNLDIKEMSLQNTFMFTEADKPGYKSTNSDIPSHLRQRPDRSRENSSKPEGGGGGGGGGAGGGRKGRWQPYYRKAIPKRTVLAGKFKHELNCNPVMTAEAKHILAMRNSDALKPKAQTSVMAGTRPTHGLVLPGNISANDKLRGFVQANPKVAKAKRQEKEKAARMDAAMLRDRLFACFSQYNYWPMRAFKQQLHQPEAWLRENLDEIAILHKSGRFANHWELKAEYKRPDVALDGEAAPDVGGDGDESDLDGDDDENIKMEDVIPTA